MARIEKTVFISYRRKDISWALAVYQYLTTHKYDVFFDYTSLSGGDFEQVIVSNIRGRAHFVLILTPTALDRCNEPGDWLRREIETAVDEKRNIIPLFFDGFSFGLPSVAEKLTGTLEPIPHYNGLEIPSGYFLEAMERLCRRYLNIPLNSVIHPVSTEVRKVVKKEKVAAEQALFQKWEDIKELIKPAEEIIDTQKPEKDIRWTEFLAWIRTVLSKRELKIPNLRLYGIGAGILLITVLGIFGINSLIQNANRNEVPPPTQTTREIVDQLTLTSTLAPAIPSSTMTTSTPMPVSPTSTETHTALTPTAELSKGGADKIAFVANKEIYLMDVDGSDPKQLTRDGFAKSDLQFLDDEILLFISEKAIKFVNLSSGVVDILTSFSSDSLLNAFRVSHDGKQVMISLNNEIFVVPFDSDQMKNVHKKSDLLALDGCIYPEPTTRSELAVREALWSADDQLVAWLFRGRDPSIPSRQAEQVSVFDITACTPSVIDQRDNFPALRFPFEGSEMPDIDWNGNDLFVFNSKIRNDGWGKLYVYDSITHKVSYPVNPIGSDGACCYRDARWSPDGNYLFLAFQAYAPNAPTLFYYVPYSKDNDYTGTTFTPLPLAEDFFKNPKEAPQPALRPAQ